MFSIRSFFNSTIRRNLEEADEGKGEAWASRWGHTAWIHLRTSSASTGATTPEYSFLNYWVMHLLSLHTWIICKLPNWVAWSCRGGSQREEEDDGSQGRGPTGSNTVVPQWLLLGSHVGRWPDKIQPRYEVGPLIYGSWVENGDHFVFVRENGDDLSWVKYGFLIRIEDAEMMSTLDFSWIKKACCFLYNTIQWLIYTQCYSYIVQAV